MTAAEIAVGALPEMVACAQKIVRTREQAEDVAQTAALRALEHPHITGDRARGWLFTVLRHEALAQVKRARRLAPLEAAPERGAEMALTDPRLTAIYDALAGCKPDEARAIVAHAAGWSYSDICAITGWSYTKVNRCLTEGRERVRELCAAPSR